ncbi:MAG: hypothetical protein ACTH29_08010 [Fusobacterium sp.]
MKKLVLSLACLCLFFVACGQTKEEKGKVKENVEKVYSEINSPAETVEKDKIYNDNGQIIVEKDNVTGKVLNYYFDGKKYKESNYKDGKAQGEFNVFYVNGNPFIESVINGEFKVYDKEGNEKIEGTLKAVEDKFKLSYKKDNMDIEKTFNSLEEVLKYSYSN